MIVDRYHDQQRTRLGAFRMHLMHLKCSLDLPGLMIARPAIR